MHRFGASEFTTRLVIEKGWELLQKLILPIKHCKLTASMNTTMPENPRGFRRWGAELISATGNRRVFASGRGTVIAVTPLGARDKAVAIWYPGALHWPSGTVTGVVLCYYHLKYVWVKQGHSVTKDTAIGFYGAADSPRGGYLYLESLTNIHGPGLPSREVPLLDGNSAINSMIGARVSPLEWLHCKKSGPDLQTYQTAEDLSVALVDRTIPDFD